MWDGRLGRTDIAKHCIKLNSPDEFYINSGPCPTGPKTREFQKVEIDKMLGMKVRETAQSKCASPIVFAPKRYGLIQFIIDYRKVNVLMIKDNYTILQMDE